MKAPRNKVSHSHRIKIWGWAWRRSREKGIIIHSINRYSVKCSIRPEYFVGPEALHELQKLDDSYIDNLGKMNEVD